MNLIHLWNRCHACGVQPIVGVRFSCDRCPAGPDNDLCASCHCAYERGEVAHPSPGTYNARTYKGEHWFCAHDGRSSDEARPWFSVASPPSEPAPEVPGGFVVRPEFRVGRESWFAPYAFVVDREDGDSPLVLTTLHGMDELLKSRGVDASELPRIVTSVALYDVFAHNWVFAELGEATSMLALPEARLGDEEPYAARDLAAFRLSAPARVQSRTLAMHTPAVGEPVWLAYHQASTSNRTIAAVVVESSERAFVFRYENPDDLAPASSGAPLLDRDGRVVGINVGAGFLDGQRFGHANPVWSIRRHLAHTFLA